MEVVVAEDGDRGVAQRHDLAQHGERHRAAVDQIADEPQPVLALREADQVEELAELGMATLDVADGVVAMEFVRAFEASLIAIRRDSSLAA